MIPVLIIIGCLVGVSAVALVVIDNDNILENHRAGSPYDYNERGMKK